MADNLVRLVVGANDADATAHLEALKRRLDEIGRKVETASVNLKGDKESEIALARIAAKLDAVGRKTERPNIKIDGIAKAGLDLMVLDHQFDKLNDKTAKSGIVTRLLGGAFSGLTGGLTTALPLIGVSATTLGVLAVAAAAAAAALTPLIASLALVGVGFAAFAAGAVGEIQKVITAHQKLAAAQQAYEKATTKAGRQSALRAERQAVEDLSGSEKGLMGLMNGLERQFQKLEKAVRPEVVKAFGSALRIIKDLMPTLTPLAVAAGKAIDGFLKHIDGWIRSPSGRKFIQWMQTEGPHAIAEFGKALWTGMQAIGRFADFLFNTGETMRRNWFRYMHDISNVLDVLRETFINVGHAIEAAWNATVHTVIAVWHGIYDGLVAPVEKAYHAIVGWVDAIKNALSGIAGAVNNALGGIPGKVLSFLGFAAGGITGAASGGPRGGLVMVGERGRELVRLPPGSQVYGHGQTEQMLAGSGPRQVTVRLEVAPGGAGEFEQFMLTAIRRWIRVRGGNVQTALGRT